MIIREPLVQATYYYLRQAPGDSPARRQDRHEAFVADARQMLQLIAGWLSMPAPALPDIPAWEADPPPDVRSLMQTGELAGRINASAWVSAYVLRNMLLLRVSVARAGEHDQTVWSMLDEALGNFPTTPTWLHTTRYWCGIAPRPPADLEQGRLLPIKTPFGVLCLGGDSVPHVLVYPDARTEQRASFFLESLAAQLDWHTVQARYRLDAYTERASRAIQTQQQALDQVARSAQYWAPPNRQDRLRSLAPLHNELDLLEKTYAELLTDLDATRAVAREVSGLMTEYRLTLMQSGLWDAAPTVWQAQVARLGEIHVQVEMDMQYIDTTLRRMELMISTIQTRVGLLQGERERLLVYLVALLGLALLAVLVVDTSPARMALRLLALIVVAGIVWAGWRAWLRGHVP